MKKRLSVYDVYQLYVDYINSNYNAKTASAIITAIRCVILRFWLTEMGFKRTNPTSKMTNEDVHSALDYLKQLEVNTLLNGRQTIQQAFDKMQVSKASRSTYGGRFEHFLTWVEQQDFGSGCLSRLAKVKDECCPILKNPYGGLSNTPLTEKSGGTLKYGLTYKEVSVTLQKELDNFYHYLTDIEYPGRVIDPVGETTAEYYIKESRLILGWFYRYHSPSLSLSELSLDLLFPKLTIEQIEDLTKQQSARFWKQQKQKLDTWLCSYLRFMREVVRSNSPKTRRQKLNMLLELAKFQYLDLVEEEQDYSNLPIFKLIRNYASQANQESNEWTKERRYVADQEKKWPNPTEGETALSYIQKEIVERLRLECRFRDNRGRIRNSLTIAREHQQYLQWYFLACQPARRQEEFCSLKVALCCPIERPDFVPANGLYHPLPPPEVRDKQRDGTLDDNYLHFSYFHEQKHYPEGVWVLDVQDYKTRPTHGAQSIIIRNRQLADGSCFYDYLERYLYGWWGQVGYHNQFYDWWQPDLKGRRGHWLTKGRADFNPHDACCLPTRKNSVQWSWGYFFLQPFVGTPYYDTGFTEAFERPAHSFIKKRPSPHTMRYIWATWAFQVGLNDAQLRSLAYAMGQTVETLRKWYECSTPQEKRRPIEEAIDKLLFPELPSQESTKKSVPSYEPEPDLDSLIRSVGKFSPDERQRLIKALQNPS